MRLCLLLLALSAALPAWANYTYQCYSIDDNEPYGLEILTLHVRSTRTLNVEMELRRKVNETYKWDSRYRPTESMRGFLKFEVSNPNVDAYAEGPMTPIFVESEVLTGGKPLRRGGQGGILKTTGASYSWANYLCVSGIN
jgi:hypothetical protein